MRLRHHRRKGGSTISSRQVKPNAVTVKSIVFVSLDELASQPVVLGTGDYLNGALCLSIHGEPIITELEWDVLDQLWAYVVDGLKKLDQESTWSTFFPDQPIQLSIVKSAGSCEVGLQFGQVERKGSCEFSVLRRTLLTEAERFFRHLEPLSKANTGFYRVYCEKAADMLRQMIPHQ